MINCRYSTSTQPGDETWQQIAAQVARMSGMLYFPADREARRELVIALCNCNDLSEATAIIDNYVERESRCPTPADIRKAIWDSRPPEPNTEQHYARRCKQCSGTGWITVERYGYYGARECECRSKVNEADI